MILAALGNDLASVLLLGLGIVVLYVIARALFGSRPPPYEKKTSLMSTEEQEFYHVLHGVVDGKWSVFAMVRMADLLRVKPNVPKPHFWRKRIQQKHVDFLLCSSESLEPILAIEFDDPQTKKKPGEERDYFVNDALASAGLPILRVRPQDKYSSSELRKTIYEALGIDKKSRV